MKTRGVLFKRMLVLMVLAVLLTSLLSASLYMVLSRYTLVEVRTNELLPKARKISAFCALQQMSVQALMEDMQVNPMADVLDTSMLSVDMAGRAYFLGSPEQVSNAETFQGFGNRLVAFLRSGISQVLGGNEVTISGRLDGTADSVLVVGVPIRNSEEVVIGALFLYQPLPEVTAAQGSLVSSLGLSILITLPLIFMMVMAAAYWLIHPLQQMRNVALAMASGDFSRRADENQRGEVGELASSLNYLSRELDHNMAALTLERNRLQRILFSLSEGIVAVNPHLEITLLNPAMQQIFGSNGEDKFSVIPDMTVWDDFTQVVQENCSVTRNLNLNNGRVLRITLTPLEDEEGKNAGAVGLFQDITESERLEQARKDYVANVSHELRTPLTALRGLIEPLSDGMVKNPEDQQRYYDIMLRETMRLSRLINDILELSRLQSGAVAFEMEPFNLSEMMEELSWKFSDNLKDNGISLIVDVPEGVIADGNADRVEQVLVILVDNAIKFTPEGGYITLSVTDQRDYWEVKVRDTGAGIAPEDVPHVFERFYKADKSRGSRGTGLGLSIASEVLERMGQRIRVSSVLGKGTEFTFTLSKPGQIALGDG